MIVKLKNNTSNSYNWGTVQIGDSETVEIYNDEGVTLRPSYNKIKDLDDLSDVFLEIQSENITVVVDDVEQPVNGGIAKYRQLVSIVNSMDVNSLDIPQYSDTGLLKIAIDYDKVPNLGGKTPFSKMYKFKATSKQTTFFDVQIDSYMENLITGGYKVSNAVDIDEEDIVEFSIIDKDDVLGLFSIKELTVGQDVLELVKMIRNEYTKAFAESGWMFPHIYGVEELLTGLYFRIAYNSSSDNDILFYGRFILYSA